MLHKFDQVCMFSPSFFLKSIEHSELYILTCCEILVCLVFKTNPVDWLKGDCYEIYLNLLTSFILVWVLSFFILQVLDRRWNMPKLQVPDLRCKVKGCWSVCSMMFVGRFWADLYYFVISCHHVSSRFSKREGNHKLFLFSMFIVPEKCPFGKSSTLLQPFPCGKASVNECLEANLFAKALMIWTNATWLR